MMSNEPELAAVALRMSEELEVLRERVRELEHECAQVRSWGEQMALLLDRSTDPMMVVQGGRVVFANKAAGILFGRTSEALLGYEFGDVIHEKSEYTEIDIVTHGALVGTIAEIRSVGVTWEGHEAYLLSFRDVTAHKQLAQRLAEESYQQTAMLQHAVAQALVELERREHAEQSLLRRDSILEAVNFAAEQFLGESHLDDRIVHVLERLGTATVVSRVTLFRNCPELQPGMKPCLPVRTYVWVAPGRESVTAISFSMSRFQRWATVLVRGQSIYGTMSSRGMNGEVDLSPDSLRSVAVVPIFVNQRWWGFLVFEDDQGDRVWFLPEIDALKAAANIIGAAVQRYQVMEQLQAHDVEIRKLHRAVEQSPNSIVITNIRGEIEYVNPKFTEVTGYTPAEVIGKNPRVLKSGEIPDAIYRDLWDTITSGQIWRGELHNRKKSGELFWEFASISPICNDDDVATHFLAVKEDITERKRVEAELRQAREAAEAATHAKSVFLATMSHEIRTPINAVIGMADLLLTTSLTDEQKEYVTTIRISSDVLLTLINDILDFSRIDAGKLEFEACLFDLRECIEESLDLVAPRAGHKGLNLAYHILPSVPLSLVGDKTRIRQILINLVSNAVKFTDQGEVVVSVHGTTYEEAEEVRVGLHLMVRDSGIGIAPEHLESIFESFSQGDSSVSRRYGGSGLGLAISKQLVEGMGGEIWAESRLGEGATFHVTLSLPVHQEVIESTHSSTMSISHATHPTLQGKRAYILSGSQTNLSIIQEYVMGWGMRYRSCLLEHMTRADIEDKSDCDVIVLDYVPGNDNGHMEVEQLIASIRSVRGFEWVPMILWMGIGQTRGILNTAEHERLVSLARPIKPGPLYDALLFCLGSEGSGDLVAYPPIEQVSDSAQLRNVEAIIPRKSSSVRILLAEDNLANQKVMLLMLQKLGYHADIVSHGGEVLQAIKREWYDIILMDIHMPILDGVQTTQAIRRDFGAEQQPYIIAVTASAMHGDCERLLAQGVDAYLSKPIRLEELAQVLSEAVPEYRQTPMNRIADKDRSYETIHTETLVHLGESLSLDEPELLDELVEVFLSETALLIEKLERAATSDDLLSVRHMAHTIKSSSAQFGALRLSHLCASLEYGEESHIRTEMRLMVHQVQHEYSQLVHAFQTLLQKRRHS